MVVLVYLRFFDKSIIGNDLKDLDTHFISALVAILLGFFYATVILKSILFLLFIDIPRPFRYSN